MTLPANMQRNITQDGDCWIWTGAVTSSGYGSVSVDGRIHSTHRLAYQLLVGTIPDGLTIDHLCGNKLCCRPEHLEPVSALENYRRWHRAKYPPMKPAQFSSGLSAMFDRMFGGDVA